MSRHIAQRISPRPSLPSGSGSAPEGLMPRREALWAGGQRGVIPPFDKACLPVGRGGQEGFYDQCRYYYETLISENPDRDIR